MGLKTQSIPYPTLTTIQRDALVNVTEGYKINNSDSGKIETYRNGAWYSLDFDESFVIAMAVAL